MATCAACGSGILWGGKRDGDLRYCNDKCLQRGLLQTAANQIPAEVVQQQLRIFHRGPCPQCNGDGPVDVHTGYRIWSVLVLTSWKANPHIGCRSCGLQGQALDLLFSLVLGWWGIPWGLIMTPVQVVRTIIWMLKPPDPLTPSPELVRVVRNVLAARTATVTGPSAER